MTLSASPFWPGERRSCTDCASGVVRQTSSAVLLPGFGTSSITAGAVESYLTVTLPLPTFPARSRQVPPMKAVGLSGPEYVAELQPATPEVASTPPKETVSAWLYQPFESGARPVVALTCGAVAS